jgi:hypothetical protein
MEGSVQGSTSHEDIKTLEKAARLALSHLLYDGPDCVTSWDAIEALGDALEPFNREAEVAPDV